MAKRKVPLKSRRRLIVFGSLSILAIFSFIYSLISYTYQIKSLSKSEKRLEQDLAQLKLSETDLKSEIQKLQDPDYVARYARENYLYSKNDEYIIKWSPSQTKKELVEKANTDVVPYCVGFGIFAMIIVIYVLIRSNKRNHKRHHSKEAEEITLSSSKEYVHGSKKYN